MKHIIIGTAGHVDHGKTRLTLALTGKNTDRLAEEQKRGITIEIGFAQLTLANGQTASIVDVPGHEKFIRNMLVGASGVDVALMIVAADEGFMPQTQEHLEILSLLGVQNGIIVITKCDLADEEWLEAIMEETRERVAGSFLENAPMLPVSAVTGQGLEELKQAIVDLLERTQPRVPDRPLRLPIDRVFSLSGYGAIVTGTLVDGSLKTGESVMLYPQQKLVRVRELQNHDTNVATVEAGMRVAVNLTGADKKELFRGCTLAAPDSMQLSRTISVWLTLNRESPYTVKNSSQLHFYQSTQELVCKVRLLDREELLPGEGCFAQLMFGDLLAARNLDKFIIRFFSPLTTIGGGLILDMEAKKLKRHRPEVLARLGRLAAAPGERLLQMITDAGCTLITRDCLLRLSGLPAATVREELDRLLLQEQILLIQGGLLAAAELERVWQEIRTILTAFHQENPLAEGMHLGELRERAFIAPQRTADAVLNYLSSLGRLRLSGPQVALADFQVAFTPQQLALGQELIALYHSYGFAPPLIEEVAQQFSDRETLFRQVFWRMCQDGDLVSLTPQVVTSHDCYQQAREAFIAMFADRDQVTLAEFRDRLGISRKFAQMYLDHFDKQKLSKMVGEARVLL